MNRILTLTDEELSRGIVAASSGNHGRAIAYGARMKGARAVIVMPRTAPEAKKKAIMELGAEVVLCEASERFEVAERICMERGSTMIPPYDDYDVMGRPGDSGPGTDGTVSGAFHSHRPGQRRRTHRRRFCGGEIRVGSYKGIRGGAVGPSAVYGEPGRPGNRCWCP